jgi:ATP-binding cassette subfamily B (MDR/TAP) protein 1
MEVGWFDKSENSSGALGARLSTDAASIRTLVGDALGLLVQDISTVITALVISFEANWQLSLVIIVLLPLLFVNGHFQIKSMQGFNTDAKVCALHNAFLSLNFFSTYFVSIFN